MNRTNESTVARSRWTMSLSWLGGEWREGRALSRGLAFGLLGLLLVLPQVGWADPLLQKLDCVRVQVAGMESGGSFGVTTEVLHEALLAGLRKHLPQLKIDPACRSEIFFKVFIQHLLTEKFDGFYGHAAFEVRRKATFLDTALLYDARAWDLESYVHGTRDQAKKSVLDLLDRYLAQFTYDYKAANP